LEQIVAKSSALRLVQRNYDMALPLLFLGAFLLLVIPVPVYFIDFFVLISIVSGVVILLTSMYVGKPLDFSVFPMLILFTTIFRLLLNVVTTRSILLHANAGHIIQTFATMVIGGTPQGGGNPVVGITIFAIIVIVNFLVITHGAQRIGEVAARFTLDAMPGKQLSIDADLNAGLITEDEARARRAEIEQEADYFGSMDGASRYVQRDAIATIILIIVNIVAGFIVGIVQMGMQWNEALNIFTRLTVGDGLVATIPALLISTATGIMVTKTATEEAVGASVVSQLVAIPKALYISAAFVLLMGIAPGMPHIFMIVSAAILGFIAYFSSHGAFDFMREPKASEKRKPPGAAQEGGEAAAPTEEQMTQDDLKSLLSVDLLELEIGYGLIPLVDKKQNGDLLDRVNTIRRQIAMTLGFIVPSMRIRDNITLKPSEYCLKLKGSVVARGELMLDRYLAMNPLADGEPPAEVDAVKVKEPAFNIDAYWVPPEQRSRLEVLGFTVVDPTTVLATHLTEVIKRHSSELLTRQGVQESIDQVKERSPALVQELIPGRLTVAEVHRVLALLLKEQVSIRNLPTALEVLGDYAGQTKDVELLAEYCRQALARQITETYMDDEGNLIVATLDPRIEEAIAGNLQQTPSGTIPVLRPDYLRRVVENVGEVIQVMTSKGYSPVFLVSPRVRPYFRKIIEKIFPGLAVLSYSEIAGDVRIKTVGVVKNPDGPQD
jgi:flagellar biosynthesis protein FlhA